MKKIICIFCTLLVLTSCRDKYNANDCYVSNNPISIVYPNMSISICRNSVEYEDIVSSIIKEDLTKNVVNYNIGQRMGNISIVVNNITTQRNWMWLGLGWLDLYTHTLMGIPFYLQDVTVDVTIEIYITTELVQRYAYSETITRYVGLYYSQDLPSTIVETTQEILSKIHRDLSRDYSDIISNFGSGVTHVNEPTSIEADTNKQTPLSYDSSETFHNTEEKNQIEKQKSSVDMNIPHTDIINANTFVVIFANEDYRREVSVPYAKNDGNIFSDYCKYTLGIPSQNIHLVENATLNDMRNEIYWLAQISEAYGSDATIIIYYAGHGVPNEKDNTAYLLPIDGDAKNIKSGYKLDEFISEAGQMGSKMVAIFLDACFSGSKREEGMLNNARGIALKAKYEKPQGNVILFTAASGDETAYPIDKEGHGLFTYFLLKKLQDSKGKVTLSELSDYIASNVRKRSIVDNNKSQTPTIVVSDQLDESWKQMTLIPTTQKLKSKSRK